MPNITYNSCCSSLFILLPVKGLQFPHVGIANQAEIPLLSANQIAEISHEVVYQTELDSTQSCYHY